MTLIIFAAIVLVGLVVLGSAAQCDARHPQAGTRCTMRTGHKWQRPVVQGMYHTDRNGRRWRA